MYREEKRTGYVGKTGYSYRIMSEKLQENLEILI